MMAEEDYQAIRKVLVDTLQQLDGKRNETLEEVACEFDKMPFGDTSASFAIFVRSMKS